MLILWTYTITCGPSGDPRDILDKARNAHFVEKDYSRAIEFYEEILNWKKGGRHPTKDEQHIATLLMIRCQVVKGDFDQALENLEEMHTIINGKAILKDYGTVITDLLDQKAKTYAMRVIKMAIAEFPEKSELFQEKMEQIRKMDLTPVELDLFSSLPYLK